MPSKVIHVGADTCHRLPVLESAGYRVKVCVSIPEIEAALDAQEPPDAVLISEGDGTAQPKVVSLVRQRSSAPIVLFRETQREYSQAAFDLVVPVLDPPSAWLSEIAALIERSRKLMAQSQALQKQSADLRHESSIVRDQSVRERQRSQRARERVVPRPDGLVSRPGPKSDD